MTTIDVEAILAELGIEITDTRRKGDGFEYDARCPHHHEGTRTENRASWSINSETGAHYCFSCGFGGSVSWLLQKVGGLSKSEARARVSGAPSLNALRERVKRQRDVWQGQKPVEVVPMTEARLLMYDAVAPEWALDKRRITPEAMRAYGIRWDSKTDAWILPIRDPDDMSLWGWQVKGEGPDRVFRNRPAGVMKSLTLFGIELLDPDKVTIVVESPLDAVLLWTLGYQAVATFGARVSRSQMELLISRSAGIILALDNYRTDKAGRVATLSLLGRKPDGSEDPFGYDWTKRADIFVFDYDVTDAKDPGELDDAEIRSGVANAFSKLRWQMRGWA